MSISNISCRVFGDIEQHAPAIFLHGIMGNQKNLAGFVQKFVTHNPSFSAITFDLRNHGAAKKNASPFTVEACADDIVANCVSLNIEPKIIVGHSFGGKVALSFAGKFLVAQVWMLDCPLGPVHAVRALHQSETQNALEIMEKLSRMSWPAQSRKDVVDQMIALDISHHIALWMTTNLESKPDGLRLVFEPQDTAAMLRDFMTLDLWPVAKQLTHTAIHVVKAEIGGRITSEDERRMRDLPRGHLHVLKNAGHFLHIDNPDGLLEIMRPFMVAN